MQKELAKKSSSLSQIKKKQDLDAFKKRFLALLLTEKTFSFTKIKNCTFDSVILPSKKDIATMQKMYAKNLRTSPELVRKRLLKNFRQRTHSTKSEFFILRYNKETCGFLCLSKLGKAHSPSLKNPLFFVSAINLDPAYIGISLGWKMTQTALDSKSDSASFLLDAISHKSFSARLIEYGFFGYRYWKDLGEPVLDFARDKKIQKLLKTKNLSQSEILSLVRNKKNFSQKIRLIIKKDPSKIPFSLCNNGFFLTRYFFDASLSQWIALFEKTNCSFPQKNKL